MNTPRTTRPRTDWNMAAMLAMLVAGSFGLGAVTATLIVLYPQ